MRYTVALLGNPNSGKTTLFNSLTGLRYKVANYPGVTVERKEGGCRLNESLKISLIDLPGVYSLSGFAPEEEIVREEIVEEGALDLIVCVLDATNLERNLYLLTQLIDSGIKVIAALNMYDICTEQGITVHDALLSQRLGVPVIPVSAKTGEGLASLKASILFELENPKRFQPHFLCHDNSDFIKNIVELSTSLNISILKSYLITANLLRFNHPDVDKTKKFFIESEIDPSTEEANRRYKKIHEIALDTQDVSHKKNGGFFEKLDMILLHRVFGIIIFILVMATLFQGIFTWAQTPIEFLDAQTLSLSRFLKSTLPAGELSSLLIDGIIAGVGSVIVFIPQIGILFFFLGLLEDSGYLSRAALIMDRLLRPVGLQGRSFIPLLSSFACAIPGILSTRTIPSKSDRFITILIAPLMSCSARLPVYTVIIAALIPKVKVLGFFSLSGLILLSLYLLGIVAAVCISMVFRRTLFKGDPSYFVMELPPLRRPSFRIVGRDVLDRVITFIKSAGTVILACSIVLWFLSSYPKPDPTYTGNPVSVSFAGHIGHTLEPLVRPLGFNWELSVAILASFAAREVFVSSLASVYALGELDDSAGTLITFIKERYEEGTFSIPTGLSLLVFYVFACMCMSTLAVIKREMGSWRWVAFTFVYMTSLAYILSYLTYHIALQWS